MPDAFDPDRTVDESPSDPLDVELAAAVGINSGSPRVPADAGSTAGGLPNSAGGPGGAVRPPRGLCGAGRRRRQAAAPPRGAGTVARTSNP